MIELRTYLHYFYTNTILTAFQKTADLFIKNLNLLGHNSVKTTMIYTHVLNRGLGVKSPLD